MLQSKSFTLDKSQDIKTNSCIDVKKTRWLHWAKFLIIPGLIGFSLLLILTNIPSDDSVSKDRASRDVGLQNLQFLQFDDTDPCTRNGNNVNCKDATYTEIVNFLTNGEIEEQCIINLILRNCDFPNSTMPINWLEGNYQINDLQIVQGNLENIEEYAFNTTVFKSVALLSIRSVEIKQLYSKAFIGLSTLQKIQLEAAIYDFAPDYLEPVRCTLNSLEIQQVATLRSPKNFIGNIPLNGTAYVNLRYNNFGNLIVENTFDSLKGVNTLYLSHSKITSIGPKAFDKISSTLQNLDLQNNSLTTVSGDIFQLLIPTKAGIRIAGNPWNCDHNLWQLAKYYTDEPNTFDVDVVCDKPDELKGKPLNVDTISQLTTTTESTTTSTTDSTTDSTTGSIPSSTTEEPSGMENDTTIVVTCTACSGNICESGSNETDGLLPLKPRDVDFSVKAISFTAVQITVEKVEFEYAILWFSEATRNYVQMETNYKEYGLGCRKSITQDFAITGLETKTSYTFCIVREGEILVSPFNCQSNYMIDSNICTDYWLLYDSQTAVIVLCVAGVLLSMFTGAFIMFCVIRCKPTLLKGNKRVVILNKSTTDVMILPRNGRSSTDTATNTAITTVSSGSLSMKRKLSTASIGSGRSYVIPEMLYEVIENKYITAIRKDNIYFERCPQHSPPPLPKRLSSENISPKHLNAPQLPLPSPTDYNAYLLTQ